MSTPSWLMGTEMRRGRAASYAPTPLVDTLHLANFGEGLTTAGLLLAIAEARSRGGGTVVLPPGRIVVDATIQLPSHVSLRGAGMGVTTLVHADGLIASLFLYQPAASTNNTISHLSIDGNAANNAGFGFGEVWLAGTDGCVHDVEVTNFISNGILSYGAIRPRIHGCRIVGVGTGLASEAGIIAPDGAPLSTDLRISDCDIRNCAKTAIWGHHMTVTNCYAKGNAYYESGGQMGSQQSDTEGSSFIGCRIEAGGATWSTGIECHGNTQILGCIITDQAKWGIYIDGPGTGTVVSNNQIHNVNLAAGVDSAIVVVPNTNGFLITDNLIYDLGTPTTFDGIAVLAGTSNNYGIHGNVAYNIAGAAVVDGGTGVNKYVRNP